MNKYIVITIIIIMMMMMMMMMMMQLYTTAYGHTQLYQEPTTLVGSWLYIAAALRKLLSWPHIKRVALF